uniref:Putative ixodes 8-cys protein n=1 Tax=Ixodes ricinus TaxID=34613 RepID=A0A0K8RB60_IXORI
MKVVCIIVLFVIVAANVSATNKADSSKDGKDTNGNKKLLNFPSFIPNPTKFASELLDICKKNKTSLTLNYNAINDKHVDFKKCTFLCKHGPHINVTLDLPEKTPCGPSGQTCANKSQCVGHIPGC